MKKTGLVLAVMAAVLLFEKSRAQLTVVDPANLAQNALTALQTLQSNVNEASQIVNQLESLANEALNLAALPISLRAELIGAVGRLQGVIASARGIAFDYEQIQEAFEALYPDAEVYGATSGVEIAERSAEWAEQTRLAVNDALAAQGLVVDIDADEASLEQLLQASTDAEGALSAAQAANEIAGLTVSQLMRLEHIVAGSLRAQTAFIARQTAGEQAADTQLDVLGADWGMRSTDDTPSEDAFLNPLP